MTTRPRIDAGTWGRLDEHIDALLARRSGSQRRDPELADALRVVAAATRTGATIAQSLERAATTTSGIVSQAFGAAAARMALGLPMDAELQRLAARIDTPAARLFAQVVVVQHRRGGDLGAPCLRLAALLHERIRLDAEARSATAQARFSARAVLAIPGLLAALAAWRSPDAVEAALRPGPVLLALPGLVLIAAGAIVARRVARRACELGEVATRARGRGDGARWVLARFAGDGPLARQGARLACVAFACCVPALVRGGVLAIAATFVAVACAAAWPRVERSRQREQQRAVAQSGIETLLEVSIALLAAGATAHQVAMLAPAAVPEPLRSALAPAVDRVGLGRTIASAFGEVPAVLASPQLGGWLHALCTSAELGAPAVDVLEQLLRDARSLRREQLRSIAQTAAPRMQLALVLLVVPGVMWLMLLATLGGLVEQLRAAGVA